MPRKTFIVWALPKGKLDRLDEQPLTSMPVTAEQAKRVQLAAMVDGWHGFRWAEETPGIPDFGATIAR